MSHRLEKETDTKYQNYNEPRTSRRRSTGEYKKRQENTRPDVQSEDAESIWKIARGNDSNENRGSFADKQQSVENITKENKKSLGSSVASQIRKREGTKEESTPESMRRPKEEDR
jgi:hypothetical protein